MPKCSQELIVTDRSGVGLHVVCQKWRPRIAKKKLEGFVCFVSVAPRSPIVRPLDHEDDLQTFARPRGYDFLVKTIMISAYAISVNWLPRQRLYNCWSSYIYLR